jgi:hypothetical protein
MASAGWLGLQIASLIAMTHALPCSPLSFSSMHGKIDS